MHEDQPINDRRRFLRLGVTVAAGVSVPPLLSSCGDGGDDGPPPHPPETYVQPQELVSKNGVLDVSLALSYLDTTLPDPKIAGQRNAVSLRNMYGTIPAPTLRIRVGDLLRIKVINNLPPNPPDPNPTRHLRYHNSTNLHTHGLHVYPDIYPQPATPPYIDPNEPDLPPLVFGDFVVDDPEYGIQPGQTRQYEYRIREDHPPGTYWYHPHLHGSSAIQVGSGMAGMLIIEGASDDVAEIDAAKERCMVFQAPIYEPTTGKLESFADVSKITTDEPLFMINGVRRPRILMRSGEVQNWRFLNAGTFNMLNLSLQGHAFYQYSHDGNRRRTFKVVPPLPDSAYAPTNPTTFPEGVVLAVGNRTDVLVKAGAPGTYLLRTFPIEIGRSGASVIPGDIVAEVYVEDWPYPMNLPPEPLPVTPFLNPITDEELAAHGGLKRTIVMRVIASDPVPPTVPFPFTGEAATPLVQPPEGELPDWVYQTGPNQNQNKVYALGSASDKSSTSPGMPTTFIPFQSSKAVTQMVALNAVEEWTIVNMNNIRHPFHIHVNPMYIVAVNGVRLAEPYWADTIPLPYNNNPTKPGPTPAPPEMVTSITFRMRFLHFTGRYVMHCHMLVHEDMGMMQGVTVV